MKKGIQLAAVGLLAFGAAQAENVKVKVLLLNKPGGYPHTTAINALTKLVQDSANAWNLQVSVSNDASNFTLPYLQGFDVVYLNNVTTVGNVVQGAARTAFQNYMEGGGGAMGTHGALDHGDSWQWYTDNMAFTKFSGHSDWGSADGKNCQAKVDDVKTNGEVRADKPEYSALKNLLPKTTWNWPDEWYSFTTNPRNKVDILVTIDETTYKPNPAMGDHPTTWTMKLPVNAQGKQGRYFYSSRGHETPAFADAYTKSIVHFGLCWAAGLEYGASSCTKGATSINPVKTSIKSGLTGLDIQKNGLNVSVTADGKNQVELLTLSGKRVGKNSGFGAKTYSFSDLKSNTIYLVKTTTQKGVSTQRAFIP